MEVTRDIRVLSTVCLGEEEKEEEQQEGLDESILRQKSLPQKQQYSSVYKAWKTLNKRHKSFDLHLLN